MSYTRILNECGIYHAYNRGNDSQPIFSRPEDRTVFLNMLAAIQKEYHFRLFAYTCMNNHWHLLYQDTGMMMPIILGILQENYAKYYNATNNHSGQVFENPFKSKPVFDITYFFVLVCYILNNPVDANIVKYFFDYEWNSQIHSPSYLNMIDTEFLNYYFKQHKNSSLKQFILENNTKGKLCELETRYLSDKEATECFYNIVISLTNEPINDFNVLNKDLKIHLIQKAYYAGLSIRQIASLSGISVRFIREYKCERDYI